jgi:tRNA(fMet)-specific endonuclease VapC
MSRYLLDTNHVSAVLKNQPIVQRMQSASGSDFGVSLPFIGELWFMVMNSARIQKNTTDLDTALSGLHRWEFDEAAAKEFGIIKAELRRIGRPIPDVDAQIAAVARLNGLTLLSRDAHFIPIAGLQIEDWL